MDLRHRIVARYLTAKPIADIQQRLPLFKRFVDAYTVHEGSAKADIELAKEYLAARDKNDVATADPLGEQLKARSAPRSAIWFEMRESRDFRKIRQMVGELFLSILQTYVLEPKVRRGIEAASRFWSKQKFVVRTKAPRGIDLDQTRAYIAMQYSEAYLKVCAEMRKQVLLAEAAIVDGKLNSDPELAEKVKIKVGSFTLVNTGGFDDKVMARVAEVVERSEKAMRSIGLGKVCYGDILVSKTIAQQNTAAFYLITSDEMFIRANIPYNLESIATVCHELGHRLQFQFLKGRDNAEIKAIYRTLKTQAFSGPENIPEEFLPQVGDTMPYKDGVFSVREVLRYNDKLKLTHTTLPGETFTMPISAWVKQKGTYEPHHNPKFRGFITNYAGKDPVENFAEMVAHHALGKLPASQVELLAPLL